MPTSNAAGRRPRDPRVGARAPGRNDGRRRDRGVSLWGDHWLAGALNDEIYDDEDWPVEDTTGAGTVD